jgi:hypothetical protein
MNKCPLCYLHIIVILQEYIYMQTGFGELEYEKASAYIYHQYISKEHSF